MFLRLTYPRIGDTIIAIKMGWVLLMKTITRICLLTLVAFFAQAVCSFAAHNVPFEDSFENFDDGQLLNIGNYQTFDDEETGAFVSEGGALEGTKVCIVPDSGILTSLVDGSGKDKIWTDMFVKVKLLEGNPAVPSSLSSAFYFNMEGYPVVADGSISNWKVLTKTFVASSVTPVTADQWVRVTVIHNYVTKKWALMINDRLIKDDIKFIDHSLSHQSFMTISNAVVLDCLVVSPSYPEDPAYEVGFDSHNTMLTGDVDGDGMPDYWEIYHFNYATVEGAGGDYDQDGVSSVTEYAQGTNPTDPASRLWGVPFRDGFETASGGVVMGTEFRGFNVDGDLAVVESAIEGGKAIEMGAGTLSLSLNEGDRDNVWVQVYAKPVPVEGELPGLSSSQVAGFLVTEDEGDNLRVFSGDEWITPNVVKHVPTNTWLGFAAHLHYGEEEKTWDLYVSTSGGYGSRMVRVHDAPLAFNLDAAEAAVNLTRIVVSNRNPAAAYVDIFAASPDFADRVPGEDGITNVIVADRIAGRGNPAAMPPYQYDSGEGEDLLDGKVGDDLKALLNAGDKLEVFYNTGWNSYVLDSYPDLHWEKDSSSSMNIEELKITGAMGMVVRRGTGTDLVVFYPHGEPPTIDEVPIYGTDHDCLGWNQLASPFAEDRVANSPTVGFNFINQKTGDRIYFGEARRMLHWTGSKWYEGTLESDYRLVPGEQFWYYHRTTGLMSWGVQN